MRATCDASRIRFEGIPDDLVDRIYADEYVVEQYRNDYEVFSRNTDAGSSYVGIYIDNELAGMFFCIDISPLETEAHIAMLKPYRYFAREICKEFIKYMFNERGVYRLTTFVADYRRTVVNMLLKIGFKYEGFMRNCSVRDGKFYGKHVLGVTNGKI